MYNRIKPILRKINYSLGGSPKIEARDDWQKYIPPPYHSVITLTADFEMAWAWRYSKSAAQTHESALQKAKIERANIPVILDFCQQYSLPITWATVGHLFLESCNKFNGKSHPDLARPEYFENEFWSFKNGDWFDLDPCSDYLQSPEWYAPDLIRKILDSPISHDIGCHTFSHIDCSDTVCPSTVFASELNACKAAADSFNITLKSFVHPGHTIGNLNTLADAGFTSFQTDPGNILGYPRKHTNGLWELQRTFEIVLRPEWTLDYHILLYKKIIDRSIKSHTVCNFWFHPSTDSKLVRKFCTAIFPYLYERRHLVYPMTVSAYVDYLNSNGF